MASRWFRIREVQTGEALRQQLKTLHLGRLHEHRRCLQACERETTTSVGVSIIISTYQYRGQKTWSNFLLRWMMVPRWTPLMEIRVDVVKTSLRLCGWGWCSKQRGRWVKAVSFFLNALIWTPSLEWNVPVLDRQTGACLNSVSNYVQPSIRLSFAGSHSQH